MRIPEEVVRLYGAGFDRSRCRSSLLVHTSSRDSSRSCLASCVYLPCLSNAILIRIRPSRDCINSLEFDAKA